MNITSIEEARKSRAPRIPPVADINNADLMLGVVLLSIVMGTVLTLGVLVATHWPR